jgi:hypothetical protein
MDSMDTARAAEMLAFRSTSAPDWNYVGTGVLRCGSCDGLLVGMSALGEVANRRPSDLYHCPEVSDICARVRAPAAAVARELQTRTQKQWSISSFVTAQRRAHLARLDTKIAEVQALQEWCSDRRRRKQVIRRLGYLGKHRVHFGLDDLSNELRQLDAERAALAAVLDNTRQPDQTTYPSELVYKLWSSDWGASLTTQTAVRRQLLVLAVEDQQLVVDPGLKVAPYVRKVRRETA